MAEQFSGAQNQIPRLFDSAAVRLNRTRAASGYAAFDFLKAEAAVRLADRLELMRRDFPLCLDVGCHAGTLTRHIRQTGKIGMVIQADPAPAFAALASNEGPSVALDVEALPFAPQQFDAVLSCYHDQGLVGFKTLAFGQGVNVTTGLPFVRTSPDHGTAFDIAGKGVANHDSFSAAVKMACTIYSNRQKTD